MLCHRDADGLQLFRKDRGEGVPDPAELERQLCAVRADGYAIENGEYKIGLRSISAPVYTLDGKLKYTIGVLGMFRSVRSEEFRQAVEQVVQTGQMLSSALGYQKK